MKNKFVVLLTISIIIILTSCSEKEVKFNKEDLEVLNEVIISIDENTKSALTLDAKPGGGMAVLKNINFNIGTIDIELKGENKPGKSFLGIAFNIQNDSTYEAIYFRPFNFRSNEKKENAIQYISPPKNTWPFLRKNHKGQYEAEYPNPPLADDWFEITLKIDKDSVYVYDKKSNTELLSIKRLENQVSDKIALWTGNNSKGDFRKLSIKK